jgi:hypothetical protein
MKKILLSLAIAVSASAQAQTFCSELFFSEIIEGSGNNKAMEIYNPTNAPVNLGNYRIVRYSNGSTFGSDSCNLDPVNLAPFDVWVVVNGQTVSQPNSPACDTALQAMADQLGGVYPDPQYQNGDDAICLVRISPYAIIDIYGKIGEDPGQSWSDLFPYTDAQGAWWTKDHTLQRKATVTGGVTVNPLAFNVTLEWDSLPEDTWTGLGQHSSVCSNVGIAEAPSKELSVYPNPSTGEIVINAQEKITRIEVINTLGEVVIVEEYSFANQQTEKRVDLSGMPGGVYMVQVQLSNGERLTSKITRN